MTADLAREGRGPFSPRTLASFVQAVLHGLAMQRAADPDAYDREEMRALVLHLLESYLGAAAPPAPRRTRRTAPPESRNGQHRPRKARPE
jgi:hypothetical protein